MTNFPFLDNEKKMENVLENLVVVLENDIQVHLNKLECRGKVHLFQ